MISGGVFWVLAGLTVAGGLGVVSSGRRGATAALSLGAAMLGLSGLYALLGAAFLSVANLILYTAVIASMWLFALVRSGGVEREATGEGQPLAKLLGLVLLVFIGLKGAALVSSARLSWRELPAEYASVGELGQVLYGDYLLAVSVASALVLPAIVAAVALSRRSLN